ncbi:hypothetical protein PRJ39_06670 [Lysobacter enzymogenes]|uniref:hypothetical protein n=1 Tax=Lysobacter enzymogenes TaxID=69 RepID=UPI003748B064
MSLESVLAAHGWPAGDSPVTTAHNAETALEMALATLDDIGEILVLTKSDSEKLRLIKFALISCSPETAKAIAVLQSKTS